MSRLHEPVVSARTARFLRELEGPPAAQRSASRAGPDRPGDAGGTRRSPRGGRWLLAGVAAALVAVAIALLAVVELRPADGAHAGAATRATAVHADIRFFTDRLPDAAGAGQAQAAAEGRR